MKRGPTLLVITYDKRVNRMEMALSGWMGRSDRPFSPKYDTDVPWLWRTIVLNFNSLIAITCRFLWHQWMSYLGCWMQR